MIKVPLGFKGVGCQVAGQQKPFKAEATPEKGLEQQQGLGGFPA